jgi:hypothetical protein
MRSIGLARAWEFYSVLAEFEWTAFPEDTSSIKAFLTPHHQAGRRLRSARPIQRRFRTRKCLIR